MFSDTVKHDFSLSSDLLPVLVYSLCLLNLVINPNKILRLGKNLPNWENTGLYELGSSLYLAAKLAK